ncbi:MAG: 30S ribosomal protein S21 [Bacteroidetes bacterium RIFOXYA2_FULL_33_7]|nr:MAG: 30S ribosomal protein S21 [Bacteroidetes bacterium RIFOXYA2_FULL_33_7]
MTKIVAKKDETTDSVIRRFNKLIQKTGLLTELKRREFYEKPSEIRKKQLKERQKKIRKAKRLEQIN